MCVVDEGRIPTFKKIQKVIAMMSIMIVLLTATVQATPQKIIKHQNLGVTLHYRRTIYASTAQGRLAFVVPLPPIPEIEPEEVTCLGIQNHWQGHPVANQTRPTESSRRQNVFNISMFSRMGCHRILQLVKGFYDQQIEVLKRFKTYLEEIYSLIFYMKVH